MQTARALEKRPNLLYPLMLIAAISVIAFSIAGTAMLMGWLPRAQSNSDPASQRKIVGNTAPAPLPARARGGEAGNAPACADCGVIESIRVVTITGGSNGLGAVTDDVAGGVLGNAGGRDSGRAVMTVVGAGSGASVGNEIGENAKRSTHYEIRVRMSDGSHRTFYQQSPPALGSGQKVRVTERGLAAAG